MKTIILIPFIFYVAMSSENIYARTIKASAGKLGKDVTQIGFALALLGMAIGAIYLILGKQDAATKITNTILGVGVLAFSPAMIKMITNAA